MHFFSYYKSCVHNFVSLVLCKILFLKFVHIIWFCLINVVTGCGCATAPSSAARPAARAPSGIRTARVYDLRCKLQAQTNVRCRMVAAFRRAGPEEKQPFRSAVASCTSIDCDRSSFLAASQRDEVLLPETTGIYQCSCGQL